MTCFPPTLVLADQPRLCRRIKHQSHNALRESSPSWSPAIDATSSITPDLLLPELFRLHPETRIVFDRYGLRGCGGPSGPHESIRFFARAHGVDEPTLLRELQQASAAPESLPSSATTTRETPEIADTIYRRYFLAGIAVVLSAGATWGAWLLWTIGLNGSFRAVSVHAINAHGEAQIFGWVGLFIMGFAYQAFPRMWQTTLVAPRLAAVAFGLMVTGLFVRTAGITAAESWNQAAPLALAGGLMQIAAVGLFAGQLLVTFRRSGAAVEAYVGFVAAALGWFMLSSVFSVWHSWHTMTAPEPGCVDMVDRHLPGPAPRPANPRSGPLHDPRRVAADVTGDLWSAPHAGAAGLVGTWACLPQRSSARRLCSWFTDGLVTTSSPRGLFRSGRS